MSIIRKAITAGVIAAASFIVKDWDGGINVGESLQVIGAAFAAFVAVYAVPNDGGRIPPVV